VIIKGRGVLLMSRGIPCCRRAILFVGPAQDDPERVVRQDALALLSRGIYRSRTIRAVSKPLQLVRSRTDQPSLA
jgi:hypothetical protein